MLAVVFCYVKFCPEDYLNVGRNVSQCAVQ
jgi:hypothetical protein